MGDRSIEYLKTLGWTQMTRDERVRLMLHDQQAYMDIVPEDHWLDIADGIATLGPVEPD